MIKVITDSASDIVENKRENLVILPITITFGEKQFQDGVNLSHQMFYEKLVESDELPVTSQVPPYAFEEAYREVKEQGAQAIVITLSSKLSGTWQSANIAAEEYNNVVRVVDSENASLGQRALVEYALRLIDSGMSFEEVVERLEGEVAILGKARGSRQGNNLLAEQIRLTGGIDFGKPFFLGYTGLSDAMLQKYIADHEALWKNEVDSLETSSVGGTIGTHIGPGAIGVAFFSAGE